MPGLRLPLLSRRCRTPILQEASAVMPLESKGDLPGTNRRAESWKVCAAFCAEPLYQLLNVLASLEAESSVVQFVSSANQVGQAGHDAGKARVKLNLGIQIAHPLFGKLSRQIQIAVIEYPLYGGLVRLFSGEAAHQRQHLLRWNKDSGRKVSIHVGTDLGCDGFAAKLGGYLLTRCKGRAQHGFTACSGTTQLADLPTERVIEPAQLSSQLFASLFRTCFWPFQGQNGFEQLSLTCTVLADDDVDARREVNGQLGEGGEVFGTGS